MHGPAPAPRPGPPSPLPAEIADAVRLLRRGTVLVVGHQPTLGQVASMVLAGAPADWVVKKGALWWISYRERGAVGETVLRVAMSPDLL